MALASESAKRLGAADPRRIELWVRAGGRCEFPTCNRYLLHDEVTGWTEVFLGEFAHIVSCADTGVRADPNLTKDQKEEVANQLLLCPACHSLIDKKKLENDLSRERLLTYKREHEERIYYLSQIAPDRRTTVLRLAGRIRGNSVGISADEVRTAVVRESGRFPAFPFNRHDIDIDLRAIDEGTPGYWDTSRHLIDQRLQQLLNTGLDERPIAHLSVFGLARIPLLVYLGYALGDKIPTEIYEKQRTPGEGWCWHGDQESVTFEYEEISSGSTNDTVLLLSVSGKIGVDGLPADVRDSNRIIEVRPCGTAPARGIIRNSASLAAFRRTFQETLRQVEAVGSNGRISVFPAIPAAAAITIGREILRDVTPPLDIYDAGEDGFELAFSCP